MPTTIEYANNPNEETAFVTPEGGQRTRAVLTTSVDGTVKFPDNPNSTKVSVTVDGVARKAVAVYNLGGGGGSDPHNKGSFLTPEALRTAYPTAEPGDFAIVESTDTVWVWDSDGSDWKDGDTKGQVTSVNGQTGAVTLTIPAEIQVSTMPTAGADELGKVYQFIGTTDANYTNGYFYKCVSDGQDPATYSWTQTDVQPQGDSLPPQTGQSGKFLTTDGTDASWATVDALPSQSGQNGKVLGTDGTTASWVDPIQVSTMPTAAVGELGKVYQFIGTTDANYTHGYFYECKAQGTDPETYAWEAVEVQAGGGGGGQNIQVSTLPTASATEEDNIYQFIGANGSYDGKYLYNGYFYKCVNNSGTYAWNEIPVMTVSYLRINTATNYVLVGNTLTYAGKNGTVAIGNGAGYNLNTAAASNYYGVMIGCSAIGGPYSTTIGYDAKDHGNGIAIGYHAKNTYSPASYSINIGSGTINSQYVVAIGAVSDNATTGSVAVGKQTKAGNYAVAVGYNAEATGGSSIAIKGKATASNAIQLGGYNQTNNEEGTFCVGSYYNNTAVNYKMMDADGTIPEARLADTTNATTGDVLTLDSNGNAVWQAGGGGGATATTATLAAANWSSNSQTVSVTGVTASNVVYVMAAPASAAEYAAAGVQCTAQASGTLTFTCTTTPSSALTVNIAIF